MLPRKTNPRHLCNLSRRSLDVGGSAVRNFYAGDTPAATAETFLDTVTSDFMVAFDIEIKRGDLRQLAPRKKLLKSCAGSLESLRAFRFLT